MTNQWDTNWGSSLRNTVSLATTAILAVTLCAPQSADACDITLGGSIPTTFSFSGEDICITGGTLSSGYTNIWTTGTVEITGHVSCDGSAPLPGTGEDGEDGCSLVLYGSTVSVLADVDLSGRDGASGIDLTPGPAGDGGKGGNGGGLFIEATEDIEVGATINVKGGIGGVGGSVGSGVYGVGTSGGDGGDGGKVFLDILSGAAGTSLDLNAYIWAFGGQGGSGKPGISEIPEFICLTRDNPTYAGGNGGKGGKGGEIRSITARIVEDNASEVVAFGGNGGFAGDGSSIFYSEGAAGGIAGIGGDGGTVNIYQRSGQFTPGGKYDVHGGDGGMGGGGGSAGDVCGCDDADEAKNGADGSPGGMGGHGGLVRLSNLNAFPICMTVEPSFSMTGHGGNGGIGGRGGNAPSFFGFVICAHCASVSPVRCAGVGGEGGIGGDGGVLTLPVCYFPSNSVDVNAGRGGDGGTGGNGCHAPSPFYARQGGAGGGAGAVGQADPKFTRPALPINGDAGDDGVNYDPLNPC